MASREQQITRTGLAGIMANIALTALKALVGVVSGSIAIIMDAVNNISDALSSVITILGVKLSRRKPDNKHPYGFGRIEYLSGIIISLIILAAGLTSFIESVKRIIDPQTPDYSIFAIIIIVVSIAVKIILGRFFKKRGVLLKSDALVASGTDALMDAIVGATTLLSAIITLISGVSIDGWLAAAISLLIIKAGIEMLVNPLNKVLGARVDSEISRDIKADIRSYPGIMGAYDLILHDYGPDRAIGSVHVEVDDSIPTRKLHQTFKNIQKDIFAKYSTILTIGMYPVDMSGDETGILQKNIKEIALSVKWVKGAHGIYIDKEGKYISFDILVDFNAEDRYAVREEVTEKLKAEFKDYEIEINIDSDYSD